MFNAQAATLIYYFATNLIIDILFSGLDVVVFNNS